MTNADLFTLGRGKGRQFYSYFLPDIVDSEEQPCSWNPAPRTDMVEALVGQRPSLDTGPCPVSELSELGERS